MRDRDSAGDCLFRLPNLTIKTLQIRQPGKNPAADEATLSDPITGRRITRSFFPLQFIQDDRWFFLYSRRVRYGSGIGFCMTPFFRKNAVLATRGTSEDACASPNLTEASSVPPILKDIPRLTVQCFADRLERREPNRLCFAGFEDGEICRKIPVLVRII